METLVDGVLFETDSPETGHVELTTFYLLQCFKCFLRLTTILLRNETEKYIYNFFTFGYLKEAFIESCTE